MDPSPTWLNFCPPNWPPMFSTSFPNGAEPISCMISILTRMKNLNCNFQGWPILVLLLVALFSFCFAYFAHYTVSSLRNLPLRRGFSIFCWITFSRCCSTGLPSPKLSPRQFCFSRPSSTPDPKPPSSFKSRPSCGSLPVSFVTRKLANISPPHFPFKFSGTWCFVWRW